MPLLGMAVNGTPISEVAEVVGDELDATRARLRELVARMHQGETVASGPNGSPERAREKVAERRPRQVGPTVAVI